MMSDEKKSNKEYAEDRVAYKERKSEMADYVENKILRITFKAKNFTQEEMDYVDEYCKVRYDNNRKLMVLDLIKYKEENLSFELLDQKINHLYNELNGRILKLNPPQVEEKADEKKTKWKGFGEQ